MANNRLCLECRKCNVEFNLAKYYPSTGWYTNVTDEKEAMKWFHDYQEFLDEHSHTRDNDGDKDFAATFESIKYAYVHNN